MAKARRLTRLKVHEVSAVDRGAGEGVRIMLAKRGDKKRRRFFTDADELVVEKFDEQEAANLAWALNKIAANDRFKADYIAQHGATTMGDHMTDTDTVDIQKAAAVAVVKSFDGQVADYAERRKITKSSALLEMAVQPAYSEAWQQYRAAQQILAEPTPADAEPAIEVSPAYAKMERKAIKIAQKEGISQASAFAKVYAARPDLVAEDKQFHFAKAGAAAA